MSMLMATSSEVPYANALDYRTVFRRLRQLTCRARARCTSSSPRRPEHRRCRAGHRVVSQALAQRDTHDGRGLSRCTRRHARAVQRCRPSSSGRVARRSASGRAAERLLAHRRVRQHDGHERTTECDRHRSPTTVHLGDRFHQDRVAFRSRAVCRNSDRRPTGDHRVRCVARRRLQLRGRSGRCVVRAHRRPGHHGFVLAHSFLS